MDAIIELIVIFFLAFCIIHLIYFCFTPLNVIKNEKESVLTASSRSFVPNYGNIPPVYPNGWYKILDSNELKPGEVKYVEALSEHLAVFRGVNGVIGVLDAFCPHLGGNLGDGKVVGDCLQCPFHEWTFRKDGSCSRVPYATIEPSFVTNKTSVVRSWPVIEANGMICLYYHAEKESPSFDIVSSGPDFSGFSFHGKSSHIVRAHIQDIAENGADVAHLEVIHGKTGPLIQHKWSGTWEPGSGSESHMGRVRQEIKTLLFGVKIPGSTIGIKTDQCGPTIVFVNWSTLLGRIILIHSVTPIKPYYLKVDHSIFTSWRIPRPIAKLFLLATIYQFEADVKIWNAKQYRSKPLLVKGDGQIQMFRRWYAQFYSKNSPTLQSIQEKNLKNQLDW